MMEPNTESLWMRFKATQSLDLKKRIMLQYSNLVHYVLQHSKFMKTNILDERDYYQFGIEGLSEAIDRFDPEYGTKFETYAIQRIRGKIIDELRKLSAKQKTEEGGEVRFVNVSLDQSFEGENGYSLAETIPSDAEQPDEHFGKQEERELLLEAVKGLHERDRLIITLYYYESLSYKEIADVLHITVSRVSQIHTRIMAELKSRIGVLSGD